jgi:hypothetical protein
VSNGFHAPTYGRASGYRLWLATAFLVFAVLGLAMVPIARAHTFGDRYLVNGCCSGEKLYGTGASAYVSYANPEATTCIAYRSDAEYPSWLIQALIGRCGTSISLCGGPTSLVKMVETYFNGIENCVVHGAANYGQTYSLVVADGSGTQWYAYIDGAAYEGNNFPQPGYATLILEGAEHTSNNLCSGWSAAGVLGSGSVWPWQRFRRDSLTWFTVQTSNSESGCWAPTPTGGPPGAFSIYH